MIPDVISLGGAAFRTSFIQSFSTKKEWIKNRMNAGNTPWSEKTKEVRADLFGQIYDLAKKK